MAPFEHGYSATIWSAMDYLRIIEYFLCEMYSQSLEYYKIHYFTSILMWYLQISQSLTEWYQVKILKMCHVVNEGA